MDMITKTRRRFMSLMMLVTAVIVVMALVTVYWITYNSQEVNNRRRLNSFEEIRVTENGTISFGDHKADAYVVERTISDIGSSFSMLVNNQGQLISTFASEENRTGEQEFFQTAADIAWLGGNYSKVELEGRMWQCAVSPAVASITMDDEQQLEKSDEIYHIRFVDITESRQMLGTLALTLCVIGALLLLFFLLFQSVFRQAGNRTLD